MVECPAQAYPGFRAQWFHAGDGKGVTMKMGEGRRLFILISILLVAGFLATSLASYLISKAGVREAIIARELPITSDNIYSEIQRDLLRPISISSFMANDTFLRDWTLRGERETGEVTRYLKEVSNRYGALTSFFVSEKTGVYYHGNGILKKVREDEPRDIWYYRVRNMAPDYEINVDLDMANRDTMTIFINHRVFDYSGHFIGATGVGLAVDSARQVIENYQRRYGRNIYFVDRSGKVVLKGRGSTDSYRTILERPGLKTIAPAILSSEQGSFEYRHQGKTLLVNARFIKELQWYLMVEQDVDPSLASLRRTLYGNLAVCFVITLIVLTATRFTVGRYQRRVEERTEELRVAKELAEDATRLKDRFVALVSHNLREPLATIKGYIQLSRQANDGGEGNKTDFGGWLSTSEKIADDLMESVGKILDTSRLQAGQISLNKSRINVHDFAQRWMDKVSIAAAQKGITIHNEIPQTSTLTGDADLLGEVLLNLLTNAIKFTRQGGTVTLSSPAPHILTVRDSGIGVHEAVLPDIFKYEVMTSTKGTAGERGTGFGLPYCQDIMKIHGGVLRVETSPSGSVFFMEFPQEKASPPSAPSNG